MQTGIQVCLLLLFIPIFMSKNSLSSVQIDLTDESSSNEVEENFPAVDFKNAPVNKVIKHTHDLAVIYIDIIITKIYNKNLLFTIVSIQRK